MFLFFRNIYVISRSLYQCEQIHNRTWEIHNKNQTAYLTRKCPQTRAKDADSAQCETDSSTANEWVHVSTK